MSKSTNRCFSHSVCTTPKCDQQNHHRDKPKLHLTHQLAEKFFHKELNHCTVLYPSTKATPKGQEMAPVTTLPSARSAPFSLPEIVRESEVKCYKNSDWLSCGQ